MNKLPAIKLFADAHVLDGGYQGSRTFIKELYTILASKEDIELYLGAYDIRNLENSFPGNDRIHFIKYKSRLSSARLAYDVPMIIKRNKIDYAHFQYIVPLLKNCRFIVTTHDVIFNEYPDEFTAGYRKAKNLLYKRSAKKADIITTVSAYSKRSIEKYLGIPSEDIHIIPNAVNPDFFAAYDKAAAKAYTQTQFGFDKFILYVSRFEPRKNHSLLLDSWLQLELYKNGYHLVMPGSRSIQDPDFENRLKNIVPEIRSFIFFSEEINNEALLQLYRAADLFVYPSKAEGFGIPPLEAAAAKVPVLCSNAAAMAEFSFFGDGLFDPNDAAAFRSKLDTIIQNPPSASALENIAAAVKEKYSWENSAEELYQLIRKDHDKKTT